VHSFWAEKTIEDGCDMTAWHAFTKNQSKSSIHRFPGAHGDFIVGSNAHAVAEILKGTVLEDGS